VVELAGLVVRAVVVIVVIVVGIALTTVSPILTVVLITWLVLGAVGWLLGVQKGHGGVGLFLGVLLGPIGLLIVTVMEPTEAVRTERQQAQAEGHCCVGRKQDNSSPCGDDILVCESVRAAYLGRSESPISASASDRKAPRRLNATVPSRVGTGSL
jgi:hypothetical protein